MNHNYCSSCGMQVIPTMKICPSCGNRNFEPTPPSLTTKAAQVTNVQTPAASISSLAPQQLTSSLGVSPGIKGWLLFLCVSMTILTPLFALGQMTSEWRDTKIYFDAIPNLKNAVMLEITAMTAITIFSIFSGVQLWTRKPNAVVIAKRFLIAQLAYGLIVPWVMVAMLSLPGMAPQAIKIAFHSIVYIVIWYPFLMKSKRVKATFP
jgi:hypothetical protein